MGGGLRIITGIIFSALVLERAILVCTECANPCRNTDDKSPCVTVGCTRSGLQTVCTVSSTYSDSKNTDKTSRCVEPRLVPGLPEMCLGILQNSSAAPGPANIHTETTTADDRVVENKPLSDDCFETTVLVSVAVGCFAAGCFFIGIIACCCRFLPKKNKNMEQEDVHPLATGRWLQVGRTREMGSTSSAQLLANGSVDTNSTHNTLLSTNEGNGAHANGYLGRIYSESHLDRSPAFSHSKSSSLPWSEAGYSPRGRPTNQQRNPSAQWLEATTNHFGTSQTLPRHWNEGGLPRSPQTRTLPSPWMESIYSPVSESSSRDYQSIPGGSENPYAAYSESSSEYSAPQTHRVMIIRDGEIYQPSSESGSSSNDYTSLKGQRNSIKRKEEVYYPVSEGSNKDYATLAEESDVTNTRGACAIDSEGSSVNHANLRRVKPFETRSQCVNPSNFGKNTGLPDINELESVNTRNSQTTVDTAGEETLADLCNKAYRTHSGVQPHEYFTLEPRNKTLNTVKP